MNPKQAHTIKTMTYDIELDDRKKVFNIQSRISALQESRINDILNNILNNYSAKGNLYRFDTIELNLGILKLSNYEDLLPVIIEEELTKYLRTVILENGTLRQGELITEGRFEIEQLEYFLLNGNFPWNSNITESPKVLLQKIITNNKELARPFFLKLGKKEQVRKRLIFQFPETLLEEVVLLVAGKEGETIINYKNHITHLQKKKTLVVAGAKAFKQALWEIILAYLFVQSKGYYDKKSFLKYFIKETATKYGLTYSSLLNIISRGITSEGNTSNSLELRKIVLELEEQEIVDSKHTKLAGIVKALSPSEWFIEIDKYLSTGAFSTTIGTISQTDLNQNLLNKLKLKDELALQYLAKWITNVSKKERLIVLANTKVLDVIISIYRPPFIKIVDKFLADIWKTRNLFSLQSIKILRRINLSKSLLILSSFTAESLSEKEIIVRFLDNMIIAFHNEEGQCHQLFEEILDFGKKKYHYPIDELMMRFYQTIGINVVERILLKILSFTSNNDSIIWSYWAEKQWSIWCKSTGLKKEQLIYQLIELNKTKPHAQSVFSFFEKQKAFETFNQFDKSSRQNQIITEKRTLETIRNHVFFVIKTGNLPWWSKDYTIAGFNEDLKTLLTSSQNRNKTLSFINSNAQNTSYLKFLTNDNLFKLWHINSSDPNDTIVFLIDFITFIKSNYVSCAVISETEMVNLKLEISKYLLGINVNKTDDALFNAVISWIGASGINKNESAWQLLNDFLSITKTAKINSAFQKILTSHFPSKATKKLIQQDSTGSNSIKVINSIELVFNRISISKISKTTELIEKLEIIQGKSPKNIEVWLNKSSFRDVLLQEMDENSLRKFVNLRIGGAQKEFFNNTVLFLKEMASGFTLKEQKEINHSLYHLVLFMLSAGNFSGWRLLDWNQFLLHVLQAVLGKKKSYQALFQKRAQNINNTSQEILDHLFETSIIKDSNEALELEKKEYKKLGEEKSREFTDPLYITSAGLIIVAPYFGRLFEKCNLLVDGVFKNENSQFKAMQLLNYLATGNESSEEHELSIHKILCGLKLTEPVENFSTITDDEKDICDGLLTAITEHWTPLKDTSIDGLRTSFLQREGKLEEEEDAYFLQVEQESYDMLLDQIPWNITKIKLSWMTKILNVQWR